MLKKLVVVGGVVAVAGLGIGGVASAWSGAPAAQAVVPSQIRAVVSAAANTAPTTSTTATTSTPAKKQAKKHAKKRAGLAKRLTRVSHAQWVTKDAKTGAFVTHDAVRGEVTAAATGSITIKATDGTSETFLVTGSTKVRVAGTTGTVAQVKVGDRAAVLGTGSGPLTAARIVDRGAPGTKRTTPKHAGTTPQTTGAPAPTTTAPPTS